MERPTVSDFPTGPASFTDRSALSHLPGAHESDGGFCFRLFAPHAAAAFVVGEFCSWQQGVPMHRDQASGLWEAFCGQASAGQLYKFRLVLPDGEVVYMADPYALDAERGGGQASRLTLPWSLWQDSGYLTYRRASLDTPVNACRLSERLPTGLFAWAEDVAPFIKQMGYTHLLLPYPLRAGTLLPHGSVGSPDALSAAVNALHRAGIGVIARWPVEKASPDGPSAVLCARHLIERFHIDGLWPQGSADDAVRLLSRLYPDARVLGGKAPVHVFDPRPLADAELTERYEAHIRAPGDKLMLLEGRLAVRRVADLNHSLL